MMRGKNAEKPAVRWCGVSSRPGDALATLREVQAFATERGSEAQLLDARMVFGEDHLRSAADHALRAFRLGRNVATTLGIEFLLYASGERQIRRAIEKMGTKSGHPFVLVIFGDLPMGDVVRRFKWRRSEAVLRPNPRYLNAYGVSPEEIASRPKGRAVELVLERVALVDILK